MHHTQEELTLRPFMRDDFEAVASIVGRTWLADQPEAAQRAGGGIELAHYLAGATWSVVVEHEGTVVGAVVLAVPGGHVDGSWGELAARLVADAEKDPGIADAVRGEMISVVGEEALEREYLSENSVGADAAVRLLIVDPVAKGLGIGGRLFSAALEHLRETGARGYHLLTDDACDVGFYDHMGLVRAAERLIEDESLPDGLLRIYVYEQAL